MWKRRWRAHFLSALAGGLVAALAVSVIPVMAGNGDPIVMGAKNKAIRSTWVASRGPSVMKIANTLNGTAVELKTAAHVAPMIVHSSTRVDGLNVDLLDGLDSSAFATAAHDHDADYLAIDGKADDSDLLDGRDSSSFQDALADNVCGVGSAVRGFDSSGAIICDPDPATTVATTGDTGEHTSIVLGADGFPIIAFYDATNQDLMVADCNDPACSGGDETVSTVDSGGDVGLYTSIVLGGDGNPIIAYFDDTGNDLKVADCDDPACSGGGEVLTTVDSVAGTVGWWTTIALGGDGNPIIAYFDVSANDLRVADCNDPACSGGDDTITVVDSAGSVGWYPSIVLGGDGNPIISYRDGSAYDLKVVDCNDPACSGGDETFGVADSVGDVGGWTSIVLGADGFPIISYHDYDNDSLKVADCNDAACSGGDEALSTVDSTGDTGRHTSILLGTDGYPIIAYYDVTAGNLDLADCNDFGCSGSDDRLVVLDGLDDVGSHLSMVLGGDGVPVLAYHDETNGDLKVVRG